MMPRWSDRIPARLIMVAALMTAVLVVYTPIDRNGFIRVDDDAYIYANEHVQEGLTWQGIRWACTSGYAANWHPVTWISHMLDVELFGLVAADHHWCNVLLHAVCAVLLFLTLQRMTGAVWRSLLVAFLFAVHPLCVESVAWAAQRKNVLSTLFWLLTLYAYADYAERPSPLGYLLVCLLFVLGLASKSMLVTLPFALLLLDYWPLDRWRYPENESAAWPRSRLDLLLEKLPLLALSAASCLITLLVQSRGEAVSSLGLLPLSARFRNALVTSVEYVGKLLWPWELAFHYPHRGPILEGWHVAGATLLLAAVTLFVVWQARKRSYLPVGWFWYLGTLVPVIGLVQVGAQGMADRYMYVPQIGLLVMLVWGGEELTSRLPGRLSIRWALAISCLSLLAIGTYRQVQVWRDDVTLCSHAIRVTSDNLLMHNNLGIALLDRGDLAGAKRELEAALNIWQAYPDAHANLGRVLVRQSNFEQALLHLKRAAASGQMDDTALDVELGDALAGLDRLTEAVAAYQHALSRFPANGRSMVRLGVALRRQGKVDSALEIMERVHRLQPDATEPARDLATTAAVLGRDQLAVQVSRKVLQSLPGDVPIRLTLAAALTRLGEHEAAAIEYLECLRLQADLVAAHHGLGRAWTMVPHRLDDAITQLERARRLAPGEVEVLADLGLARLSQGRPKVAVTVWREGLRQSPENADLINNLSWVLATSSEASVRNGEEALALAEHLSRLEPDRAGTWDTLAAAYAEQGCLDEAVTAQEKAIELSNSTRDSALTGELEARLVLYRSGKAYREGIDLNGQSDAGLLPAP